MNTTIINREDIVGPHKDGMLIKEWERGNVTLYVHLAKLDGKFSDIYYLQVTNLKDGQKEYEYTGHRPIISELNVEQFLDKYHGTQII
jgi:hypothetical protein